MAKFKVNVDIGVELARTEIFELEGKKHERVVKDFHPVYSEIDADPLALDVVQLVESGRLVVQEVPARAFPMRDPADVASAEKVGK